MTEIQKKIDSYWEEKIVPTIMKYIEIPAKSPAFDPNWQENGYIHQALELVEGWIEEQQIPGLTKEVLTEPGRTPLLFMELPGNTNDEVLMYGHLDKQPEMIGWSEGLAPWKAVRRDEKIYGRGGADDGYAVFACLAVIETLLKTEAKRPHIKIAIEFSEESGSDDLPFYFEKYRSRFGQPKLVVCLDSGAGNYEQMWSTTSLRGLVNGVLKVEVLNEGVHSGEASGIVPDSFRIARQLIERIEDGVSGKIIPEAFQMPIPKERIAQAERAATALGDSVFSKFPFSGSTEATTANQVEILLNGTWRSALTITGADGLPELVSAGNVLRPSTSLKLSLRVPPTLDARNAGEQLKKILEKDPPYNSNVSFALEDGASGWNAPPVSPTLDKIIQEASKTYYGYEALAMGEGGSIPFMGMLGEVFPDAQFIITGVLGPGSNAHGPNEFLHVEYAKKLTACIFHILSHLE